MLLFVNTLFTLTIMVFSQSQDRQAELFWPQSWVSSQIELSTNHHSVFTDISLYLYTSLNISASFAQISLPQLTPTYTCSISKFKSIDYKIFCQGLSLGRGLYGPINLLIKSSELGKTLAQAPNFGTFSIISLEPDFQPLGVNVESDVFQVNSSCTLSFNLTITKPVHKNDYLVLKIDPNFKNSPTELSWRFDYNGSFSLLTTQWLFEEESRKLYIYGISEDITSNQAVGFDLIGLIAPPSITSDFYWELGIYRFGVNTLIDKYSCVGLNSILNQGNVEIIDWKFVHPQLDSSDSAIGLVSFTELSFVISTEVPVSGWINIVYAGVDICSYKTENNGIQNLTLSNSFEDCGLYVNTTNDGTVLDCEVKSSTNLTCTVSGKELVAGSTVFVYNLVEITDNSKINSIKTFDYNGNSIDTTSETVKIDIGINSFIDIGVIAFVQSENNANIVNQAGTSGFFGLVVEFVTIQALQTGDNFTLYLPITKKSSFNEHFVAVGQHFYAKYAVTDGANFSETTIFTYFSNFSVSEGSISVQIIEDIDELSTFILYLGSEDSEGSVSGMFMPLIPNDISYLFQIVLKIVTTNTNFVYSSPFYIALSSLNTWFRPFCKDVWIDGLPIELFLQLDYYLRSHNYQFFAIFQFDDLSPGLADGDSYPSKPSGAEFFEPNGIKYYFESFTQGVSQSLIIPFYKLGAKVHNMKCSLYYKDKAGVSKIMAFGEFLYDLSGITEKNKENGEDLTGLDLQGVINLNFEIGSLDEETYNIAVLGDFGFELNSLKIKSGLNIDYLSSDKMNYSAGFFTDELSVSKSEGKYTIQIKNVWFTIEDYYVYFIYMAGEGFIDGECTGVIQSSIHNEDPLNLTLISYGPETKNGYSFSSEYMSIELYFQFEGTIRKGSYLTISQGAVSFDLLSDTDWQVSSGSTQLPGSYSTYWESEKISASLANVLKIRVNNVKRPVIYSESKMKLLSNVVVYSEHGKKSYEWVQKEYEALCNFQPGNTKSADSGVKELSVLPNTIGNDLVRFFVSFKPGNDIPEGATIYIDAHFDNLIVSDSNIWCNYNFKEASISDGILSLKLQEKVYKGDLVEIVKDEAFNISSKMIRTVSISAKKDSYTMINDDYEIYKNQKFSIIKTPEYQVTELHTSLSLSTPGFESWHHFEFYLSTKASEDWTYILEFSKVYNINIGPYQTFFYLPGLKYLPAVDENNEEILCTVKNWMVFCKLGKKFAKNSKISFALSVFNPYPDGLVNLYIANGDDKIIIVPKTNIIFEYSPNPINTVDILYSVYEYEDIFELRHSLTLQVFAELEMREDDVLKLVLPDSYDLEFYNITSLNCSILNDAGDLVAGDEDCEVDGQTVSFIFRQEFEFKSSELTNITVRNLYKPSTGYTRDVWVYENTDYMYWTKKFKVYVERNKKVLAQSIENLHSGFFGFNSSGFTRIQVNSGKTIKLSPGIVYGEYSIEAGEPFLSEKVRISARFDKDSGIVLSGEGEYELSVEQTSVFFSIGIDESAQEGFYYIYWDIEETPLISYQYLPPLPTVLKVKKVGGMFELAVESGFSVLLGVVSQPIYIETQEDYKHPVYPLDHIQIHLEVSNNQSDINIQFFPNPLNFSFLSPSTSFTLFCNNCITGFEYNLKATILNNNTLFYFPNLAKFYVQPRPTLKPECTLDITKLNPSTLAVSLTTNSPSRVVWTLISEHLLDKDPTLIKKSSILANSFDYAAPNANFLDIQAQFNLYSEGLDNLLTDSDFSYQDFALKAKIYSKSTYFTSISIVPKGSSSLYTFSKLLPSHTYFIQAFVDNFSGNSDSICSSYTTTGVYQPHGKVIFYSSESYDSKILLKKLSWIYQTDSYYFESLSTNLRLLLDSSTYLVYSSITESISGYDLVSSVSEASLLSELQYLGIVQVEISELDPLDYERMYWVETKKTEWVYEEDQMTFKFIVSTAGVLYCIVQEQSTMNETVIKDTLLAGVCWGTNNCWKSKQIISAGSQEWVFNTTENNATEGEYRIDCIACNSYPITPSCSSIKNTTLVHIIADLSWGMALSAFLAWIIF